MELADLVRSNEEYNKQSKCRMNIGNVQVIEDRSKSERFDADEQGQLVGDGQGQLAMNTEQTGEQVISGQSKLIPGCNVVNLSERELTQGEISLLSKGLKFCPTPKELNRSSIKSDLKEFGRKIKCKYHFLSNSNEHERQNFECFKERSGWCPRVEDSVVTLYLNKLEERVNAIKEDGRNYSNLSGQEQQALRTLKNSFDIVIKEADKGGAIVVWGREDYCNEAYRQLNDKEVYELVESVDTKCLEKVSESIAAQLDPLLGSGYINQQNKKYLVVRKPHLGKFYLLPKIHKGLEKVPGRPVISNCGTATERISEFLDFHIQPLVNQLVPSVIKDTTDFLKKLNSLGYVPNTAILCTIDIVGLYPHIPHCEGLDSLRSAFEKSDVDMPIEGLVSLAKIILESNYFEFEDKVFRQKLGTAIGTKFAPGFANIFMGGLEKRFLDLCELVPWVWWRFLDDVFLIWLHSLEELKEFLERLNRYHGSIKFTWEIAFDKIAYLDVMVTLSDGGFSTDVYHKPTDAHQYLNFKSCHPSHVKKGIPYGQGLRLRRICSSEEVF